MLYIKLGVIYMSEAYNPIVTELDFIYQKRILTESAVYKVFEGVE